MQHKKHSKFKILYRDIANCHCACTATNVWFSQIFNFVNALASTF